MTFQFKQLSVQITNAGGGGQSSINTTSGLFYFSHNTQLEINEGIWKLEYYPRISDGPIRYYASVYNPILT